jgi:hypothetical protein
MGETNVLTLIDGYVNTVADTYPGGGNASPGLVPGQLGKIVHYDKLDLPVRAASGDVACYEGEYQYVLTRAGGTITPVAGMPAFWYDKDNYIVTADLPTDPADIAGVFVSGVTKGLHTLIKRSGDATGKFLASPTKTTPAIGDAVISGGTGNFFDVLAVATAVLEGGFPPHVAVLKAAIASTFARITLLPIAR